MKNMIIWFYKQLLKHNSIREYIKKECRDEAIAYTNWLNSKSRERPLMNENGTWKSCWQMYDYFYTSDNRLTFINHAKIENKQVHGFRKPI